MRESRREFFSKSAKAAGIVPVAASWMSRLAGAAQANANDQIALGLIGCGGRGQLVLSHFLSQTDVQVPVVCDVDDARLARAVAAVEKSGRKRPDTVKDFRRVLERKEVDACLIATPDNWHALPAVYASQAGKDVYLEKPMAATIAEERAIVEAVRRHKRVFQLGTQWRSGMHYQEAVGFVQSGQLGKIRQVRAWAYLDWCKSIGNPPDSDPPTGVDYDMWLGPAPQRPFNRNRFHFNFRWFWDYAGGLMTDWGVHLINLMFWALGPASPRAVDCAGGKYLLTDASETPDTLTAVYQFPTFTFIWEHQILGGIGLYGRPTGIAFTGSEGTLVLNEFGWDVIPERISTTVKTVKNTVERMSEQKSEGGVAHVRNFLDCCRSRQDPVSNADAGHLASSTAHLGNIALRTGSRIVWDPQKRRTGDNRADQLISRDYRAPWSLPYMES